MWIELHQSVFTHRKTMKAADLLDLPEVYVVGHLTALWTWALDNAQDGVIEASPRILARACQWTGDPAALLQGLIGAGFLMESEPGRYEIQNWHEYAGKLMDRREKNAERQKRYRDKQVTETPPSSNVTETSLSRNAHVTHTLPLHNRHVTTLPDQTDQYQLSCL